jgi:hypothetical protein
MVASRCSSRAETDVSLPAWGQAVSSGAHAQVAVAPALKRAMLSRSGRSPPVTVSFRNHPFTRLLYIS